MLTYYRKPRKGYLPYLKENTTISCPPMDVGRTNLFQMDIPSMGQPVACKHYPIPLKYQTFVDQKIKLQAVYQKLSQWAVPVIIVPKNPDPRNLCKQQLHLVLHYRSLYKLINATHNGNSAISYYYYIIFFWYRFNLHSRIVQSSKVVEFSKLWNTRYFPYTEICH